MSLFSFTRGVHEIGTAFLFACLPCRHGHIDEHIFEKDSISRCRIVDQHVRHRADDLIVLNDGGAAHECGQEGTTVFYRKFMKIFAKNTRISIILAYF